MRQKPPQKNTNRLFLYCADRPLSTHFPGRAKNLQKIAARMTKALAAAIFRRRILGAAMPLKSSTRELLENPPRFRAQIVETLLHNDNHGFARDGYPSRQRGVSVVFLLIGLHAPEGRARSEPCILLNKRSPFVRQPGDLCCPGGGLTPRCDAWIGSLLRLPGSPLFRWPGYKSLKRRAPQQLRQLSLLVAAALREGLEEMRLNPLDVRFLGRLPSERLVMFQRLIHPLVGWVGRFQRLAPNWEVERIVWIPVRRLLDPGSYIRLRTMLRFGAGTHEASTPRDFPAFRYGTPDGGEILWGATYRITMAFLAQVLDFTPPDIAGLPIVARKLGEAYLTGSDRSRRGPEASCAGAN